VLESERLANVGLSLTSFKW